MVIIENKYNESLPDNFTGKLLENNNGYLIVRFVKKSMYHRYYGPAYISDYQKTWDFNNIEFGYNIFGIKNYSQKQFIKEVNKLWLL